ncbi:MAG: hypothetical protein H7301_05070 [Cryobacterium sp.]|nr:hypothetical protein [Oligoflexia bacterium]
MEHDDTIDTENYSELARKILPLYLGSGLTHKEIALRLKRSPRTIANLIAIHGMSKHKARREAAVHRREADRILERQEQRLRGSSIFGNAPVNWKPNFVLHAGQQSVLDAIEANFASPTPASIVTIVAARGFGKTIFAGSLLIDFLMNTPNGKVLWVAPHYSSALALVDELFKGVDDDSGERFLDDEDEYGNRVWEVVQGKSGLQIRWSNGATVSIRSAENPESLVSRGYDRIFMDEAALIGDSTVFHQRILGTARKKGSKIFLVSTPRGRNWFRDLYLKGQDDAERNYLSFHRTYRDNPRYSNLLIDLMAGMPDWIRRQEYEGEFLDDGTGVFTGLDSCIKGDEISFPHANQEWAPPIANVAKRTFVVGLDLAKQVDFTVMIALDASSGECVYYRRVNKVPYLEILPDAARLCERLNHATLIYDATGVGSGLSELVDRLGISTRPFVFTNSSKQELINKLAVSIERNEIILPNIQTVRKELSSFTYGVSRTGKIVFESGAGIHDDIVMALALANFERIDGGLLEVRSFDAICGFNFGHIEPRSFREWMDQDND